MYGLGISVYEEKGRGVGVVNIDTNVTYYNKNRQQCIAVPDDATHLIKRYPKWIKSENFFNADGSAFSRHILTLETLDEALNALSKNPPRNDTWNEM